MNVLAYKICDQVSCAVPHVVLAIATKKPFFVVLGMITIFYVDRSLISLLS